MAYRGFSGGGFVGNHLTTALLEQLRPAADNAGRHATVGSPDTVAAPYVSDGASWKSVPLLSADGTSLVSGDGNILDPGSWSGGAIPPSVPTAWQSSSGTLVADWASCTDALTNSAARSTDADGNGTTRAFDLNVNSSGSTVDITGFPAFSLNDTKNVIFWVKASQGYGIERPLRVLLVTDPGGAFTTYFEVVTSVEGSGEWTPICIPRGSWTAQGGATWDAVVTKIRFRANDSTNTYGYPILANAAKITVGSMKVNAVSRASVLWSWDDGHQSIVEWGALLATYGWAGTAYIYPNQIGYQTRATREQLKKLKSLGWLIGNHSNTSPDDLASNGTTNLGPIGRGINVTSFGASNVVNVATNRAPPSTTGAVSAMRFTAGTIPAELALNVRYWARGLTASTMNLYSSYDGANEQDATTLVAFTASATTATWEYWDSAVDSTAIRADFESAADSIRRMGFGDDGLHVALPQSAYDMHVVNALRRFGTRTVRSATAYGGSGDAVCRVAAGFPARRNGATGAPLGSWCTWPGAADIDNLSAAQVIAYIDSLIDLGGSAHIYGHSTPDAAKVASIAAHLKSRASEISVTNPAMWLRGESF